MLRILFRCIYKCLAISTTVFRTTTIYRVDFIMGLMGTCMMMYLSRFFWTAVYGVRTTGFGVELPRMVTYGVIGMALGPLLQVDLISWLSHRMRTGEILIEFLRPIDLELSMFSQMLGRFWQTFVVRTLPAWILAVFLMDIILPSCLRQWGVFLISLMLAYIVLFEFDLLLAIAAFYFTDVSEFQGVRATILYLLSGIFVPLWLFPDWVQPMLRYAPFRAMHATPLAIYIGQISLLDASQALQNQILWVVGLFILGRMLLAMARRHLTIHGG